MTTLFRHFFFFIIFLWCGLVFASNEKVVQVHELQHTEAKTVLPVIESLLEKGETVQILNQRLIIHATSESQEKIRHLLDQIDVPRKTLTVEVKQVKGRLRNAVRVGTSSSKTIRSGTHLGNTRSSITQYIRVLDGEAAFIVVGEDVPYASAQAMVSGRHEGFYQKTDYKKIRTGFRIRPIIRGKMVDVEILPFRESAQNKNSSSTNNPPAVDYQQALTRLRVPLGSWFDVGGTAQGSEQDDLGTIRWGTGRNVQDSSIQLRIQSDSSISLEH